MKRPESTISPRMPNAYAGEQHGGEAGPQGEALILELQRLRHAFELEFEEAPQRAPPPRKGRAAAAVPKQPRAKKAAPRKMARAIDVWLRHFGFGPAALSSDQPVRERSTVAPGPRARAPAAPVQARPPKRGDAAPRRFESKPHQPKPFGQEPYEQRPYEPTPFEPRPFDITRAMRSAEDDAPPRSQIRVSAASVRSDPPLTRFAEAVAIPPVATRPASAMVGAALASPVLPARGSQIGKAVSFLFKQHPAALGAAGRQGTSAAEIRRSFDGELRTGLRVLLVAGTAIGGWATLMPLAGAVVVPGNLVVESNVKTVQHPTGGVVAEIAVRDGARVRSGDLLVRLDPTQARASLQVVAKQLDDSRVRIARLLAERGSLPAPVLSPALEKRSADADFQVLLASEQALFKARASARESQKELLNSRIVQLGEEVSGIDAQLTSKVAQLDLIAGELTGVQELFDKRLVPLTRLTTLQRERARIEGERGQLLSAVAETKAKIGEAQLQIVRADQDFRTEVMKDLGEAQSKEAELSERGIAARDTLDRIELRAPTPGVVHQLAVHTVGGVIRAGDTVLQIVPDSENLLVEARLQPNDIDQVRTGQKAFVRLSAFNQRVTPQLIGEVSYVSADTSHDQQTNAAYFSVRVTLPEQERRKLAGLQLVAGMPAEVFMQTGSRSMISYLVKPITDQLARAFVER
jgi:HlyD family secretion protein